MSLRNITNHKIKIYQRDLFQKSLYKSTNVQKQKKAREKKLLEALTITITSVSATHTLNVLKRYFILFVMSSKVGLIKGFSIQQLCISAYL